MKRAKRLAAALHAVSTSPPMRDFRFYMQEVEALRPHLLDMNRKGVLLGDALARVHACNPVPRGHEASATDFLVALSSFVDDYTNEIPLGVFRLRLAKRILESFDELRGTACLTADKQLDLALRLGAPTLLDATMALHTATRVLARGRDRRLGAVFQLSLPERLVRSPVIAPFHPSDARGGDPMGDTYHYWANVSAGLFSANLPTVQQRFELRRPSVALVLLTAPVLMTNIRGRLFGNTLFYGNHARIDRMGLAHGYRLGRLSSRERVSGA